MEREARSATFESALPRPREALAARDVAAKSPRWILVTGAPRSGTSFIGRILSWPLSVDLIFEPTDPIVGMHGINHRYFYLRDSTTRGEIPELLRGIFEYRIDYRMPEVYRSESLLERLKKRTIGTRGRAHLWTAKLNAFRRATVLKDPDSVLSTEYLYHHYNVQPVLCFRHPVAFVASYIKYDFPWDIPELTRQPQLMEDYFAGLEHRFEVSPEDNVGSAAVLWWALNKVLLEQWSRHPEWTAVIHEDLCAEPQQTFRSLFRRLELPWSGRVERVVRRRTGGHNKTEAAQGRKHDHHRNAAELFEHRRRMLSREDRARVFEITREVALRLYSRDSFGID